MATSAIRARISTFESMSQTSSLPVAMGPRKPPIKLIDDEQCRNAPPSILDSSSPPGSSSLVAHKPIAPIVSRSPSPAASAVSDFVNVSPPRSIPPPLPPRKASDSVSISSSSSPGLTRDTTSSSSPSGLLSPTSHSALTVGGSYPPSRSGKGHAYANSTSSFHSVSLSDAVEELDGSFETLSTPRSVMSTVEPATRPSASLSPSHAPALPPRPGTSIVPTTPTTPMPYAVRSKHPPPPHPSKYNPTHKPSPIDALRQDIPKVVPRSSRSSLISTNSTSSSLAPSTLSRQSTATRRRTPLPPAAKVRYDAVFDANMRKQHQREQAVNAKLKHSTLTPPRRAVGWRGVSVDLTTNGAESLEGLETVLADAVGSSALPDEERLPGSVVRLIWSCSNLPKETLRKIWAECDSDGKGCLNKQEFAVGMWSVDCELSSAQTAKTSSFKRSGTTKAARRLTAQC